MHSETLAHVRHPTYPRSSVYFKLVIIRALGYNAWELSSGRVAAQVEKRQKWGIVTFRKRAGPLLILNPAFKWDGEPTQWLSPAHVARTGHARQVGEYCVAVAIDSIRIP